MKDRLTRVTVTVYMFGARRSQLCETVLITHGESGRQMRGTVPAQIPDAKILVCQGVGGRFAASGTIIILNEA